MHSGGGARCPSLESSLREKTPGREIASLPPCDRPSSSLLHHLSAFTTPPRPSSSSDHRFLSFFFRSSSSNHINTAIMSETKEYTYQDVAEHNTKKDCFLVIHDKVYDCGKFVDEHP